MTGPDYWRSFGDAGVGCKSEIYVDDKSVMIREPSCAPYRSCRHDEDRCAANDIWRDVSVVKKREFRYVGRQT